MWRSILDSQYLLRSPRRILILLIQVAFSGIREQAIPFRFFVSMHPRVCPSCRPRCFTGIKPGQLQSIFDQLPNLLSGIGLDDFIGLTGVQLDILFATAEDTGGKPLSKLSLWDQSLQGCLRLISPTQDHGTEPRINPDQRPSGLHHLYFLTI